MKKKRRSKATAEGSMTSAHAVPGIVGIGASAGGLEAFMRLLHNLEPDTGLAYVLVQHLSREHESLLPELLGKATTIPVVQAVDGMAIEANHTYVIPPNTTMTVVDGHLRLVRRPKGRGLHLPIDVFLCSLAEVHGVSAAAVILSGAGSDGSRGVEAIKEYGGIVFAQDSESARHPSMPEAAIATGTVDFVLPPEKIAEQLGRIGGYFSTVGGHGVVADGAATEDDLTSVLKLLHRRTGVDFAQYRRGTVGRRVLRRMLVNRTEAHRDYLSLIKRDPGEVDQLYQDLLIGVTSFFRDPEVFEELRDTVFPKLLRTRRPDAPFRLWVAGCSGGEETYSLAIALIEFLEEAGIETPVQIFGTDLSEPAITRARAGVYPEGIAEHVSAERLRRFFVPDRGGYRIAKFVRDLCIFSKQNIVRDPPFSHLDLISCRNVLIYFEPTLQRKVFPIFHYALEPHGMLLLGNAESPGEASEFFEPINKRHKIYRRLPRSNGATDLDFVKLSASSPASVGTVVPRTPPPVPVRPNAGVNDLDSQIDALLLEHFGRNGVIVGEDLRITMFRGDTTPYLAHGSGSASLDVLRLARPEIAVPLRMALSRAMADNQIVREKQITTTADGKRQVTVEVLPLSGANGAKRLFLVLFRDEAATEPSTSRARATKGKSGRVPTNADEVQALRSELVSMKTYLSEIIAQHEANIEELRAAGEEIQSSNEELQSTNEELETAKEEVQSANEELSTLNDELRHRNRELDEVAGDLANVFASTTMPIAIVGRDLRLRRFTPSVSRVMKVMPTDVGRPIGDVKLSFKLQHLETLIGDAVQTLAVSRHLVQGDDGAWWALTIRPYQTPDRRVDGAMLVFADGAAESEERRLALAAEAARVVALRNAESLSANIAEREHAEADRNELRRQLESAGEDERRRLSRELHDGVGQHLTAIGLGLHALSNVTPVGSEVDLRTADLRRLVSILGQELHGIAVRLRPKVLDDFGLELALSSYVEEWSKRSGIAVDIHAPAGPHRLPALIEDAMFRVTQEALNNVAKHSSATRASVEIERRDGHLHVIVEDNGKGFEFEPSSRLPKAGVGLGLLGIRERVALLGGTVDIETTLGKGTTLFVRVPVDTPGVHRREDESAGPNDE